MNRPFIAMLVIAAPIALFGCMTESSERMTVERVSAHLRQALPALAFERTTVTAAGRDMDALAGQYDGSAKLLIIGADDMRDSMDVSTARGELAAVLVNAPFSLETARADVARVQELAEPLAELYGGEVASWSAYAIDRARRDPTGIQVRAFGAEMKVRVTWGEDAGQITFSIETPSYPLYWNDTSAQA